MSVISDMEATPNRVRLLVSVLAERPSGETQDRLRAFCSPDTLHRQVPDPIAIFRSTLAAAKGMRLIEEVEDRLRVCAGVLSRKGSLADDLFLAIEKALLPPEADQSDSQVDFARAMAWFLMQSPRRPLQQNVNYKAEIEKQIALTEVQDQGPRKKENVFDLSTAARFNSFHYWARFLGYAEVVAGRALVADPTVALRRFLPQAMSGEKVAPIHAFLGQLAKLTPVFENGRVRREIESDALPGFQREPQRLSASTSFALLRLEQAGEIRIAAPSDAQAMILDLGPDAPRRISHIELGALA